MKKIIYLVLFVLLSSFALAETFNVDDVRVYVGDSRQRDVGVGGESFEASREDVIKFRVTIENEYPTDIKDVKVMLSVIGIQKNGDDIDITSGNVDIQDGNKEKINLEFTVPSDTIYDVYDIEMEIEGEFENNTDLDDWFGEWEIEIIKQEEEDVEEKSELHYYLTNCTSALEMVPKYIDCEREKNDKDIMIRTREGERDNFKEGLDSCNADLKIHTDANFEINYNACVSQKSVMLTEAQCELKYNPPESEPKKGNNDILIVLGVGTVIFFLVKKKKQQEHAEEELQ